MILYGFVAVTAARLVQNWKTSTPGWTFYVWTALDFLALGALLFSYHISYSSEPGLYLKATTADMIFVLLAMRVVLLDLRLIVFAGFAAGLTWAGLTVYAVLGADESGLTRSFVDYMTSEHVLIGAQVERLGAIGLVAAALALAILQTRRDALTGLANGAGLYTHLDTSRAARRPGAALYLIEADALPEIVEAFGVETADTVLRDLARRIRTAAGPSAFCARIEAGVFAVVLPASPSDDDCATVADHFAQLDAPFEGGRAGRAAPRLMVGAAQRDEPLAPDAWVAQARAALINARRTANGRIAVFTPKLAREASERVRLEAALREAVRRKEFYLHYQPIVDMHDGAIIAAEGHVIWRRPEHGLVRPEDFVPVAEASGLAGDISVWAVAQAARDQAAWRAAGAPNGLAVSVNVSAAHLKNDANFEGAVRQAITDGATLELEISEAAFAGADDAAQAALKRLAEMGASLAIDDFGAGASAFARLADSPFQAMKIEAGFTARCEDAGGRAMLKAFNQLARGLGVSAIVQGVDTEDQRAALLALGFRHGQGRLFARPMPLERFIARYAATGLPFSPPADARVTG